jgi:hypothetical protein
LKTNKVIRVVCIILSLVMLLSILPAFIMCLFTFPSPGDDYLYATPLLKGLEEKGPIALVTVPFSFASERYANWQGSYVSCMMFALNPMVFSVTYYRLAMLLMNIIFLIAVFSFSYTVFGMFFELKDYFSFLIGSTLLAAFYHCVPFEQIYEMSFWYTGAVFYFITLSVFLLFISSLYRYKEAKLSKRNTSQRFFALCLMAIFLGLNNLTTSISVWSGFTILLFLAYIKKSSLKKPLTLIYIILTISVLFNALSPGYMVRYNHGIDQNMVEIASTNIIDILKLSFTMGTVNIRSYATISPVIGIAILFTPFMLKGFHNKRYVNPLLLLVATYLILIAQYAPFLYALGDMQYGRIIAYRFFTTQIFIIVNYINFIAFIASRVELKKAVNAIIAVCCLSAGLFLTYHCLNVRILPKSHMLTLYDEYQSGKMVTFISQRTERIAILEDESIKDVAFKPLTETHVSFGFDDTSTRANSLINRNLADYYNKESVVVSE